MTAHILNQPTLVLNRSWQAVNVKPLNRALCMAWSGSARIIDPDNFTQYEWSDWARLEPQDGEAVIQCVGFKIRVPEVITLISYSKVPHRCVPFSRRNLFIRDEFQCQYCGKHLISEDVTVDHVNPRSLGGVSSWLNCVVACLKCNMSKADKTLKEAKMKLRKEPKEPVWRPDFHCRMRIPSWEKFVSAMYWNVELEK